MNNINKRLDILIKSIEITNGALLELLNQNIHTKQDYRQLASLYQKLNSLAEQHDKLLNGDDKT